MSLPAPLTSALDAASKLCLWKWRVSCGIKAGIQGFNLCVIVTGVENVCVAFELPDFIQTWSGDTDTLERVSYLEKSVVFKSPAAADTAALCTSKGLHTWSSSCFSTRPSTWVEADLTTVCADDKFKLERPKSSLRSVNLTRHVSEFSGKEACRVQESISILTGQTESVVGWTNSTPAWPIWSVTILNFASEVFLSSCEVVTTEFSTLKSSKTSSLAVAMASLVESSKDSFSRLNSSSFLNKSCFLDRVLASAKWHLFQRLLNPSGFNRTTGSTWFPARMWPRAWPVHWTTTSEIILHWGNLRHTILRSYIVIRDTFSVLREPITSKI